jgi:2-methylisocitrate lyase-like PEP mutase family enzyme
VANQDLKSKAQLLRSLHVGAPLVLPNAWDAASAVLIADAGAQVIATTSGGAAWSLGRPDGQALSRDQMVEVVSRVVAAVDVPVTADVEGGYGPGADDVAATVEAVVAAGAVGVNIEDSKPDGSLFEVEQQAARIRAAREAAERSGLPELVVNVRTDVFLFGIGEPGGRLADVVARSAAYAEAGADSLFVPGLVDLDVLKELVEASSLPVNVMAGPGAPTVAEFAAVGVARISVGTAIAQAAYTLASRAATELTQKGTYSALEDALDFGAVNSRFA